MVYSVPVRANFSRTSGPTFSVAPLAFGWIMTPKRAFPILTLSARGKVTSGDIVGLSQGVTKQEMTNYIKEQARSQHNTLKAIMTCIQKLYWWLCN